MNDSGIPTTTTRCGRQSAAAEHPQSDIEGMNDSGIPTTTTRCGRQSAAAAVAHMTRANDDDAGAAGIGAVAHMTRANDDDAGAAGIGAVAHMTRANDDDAGAAGIGAVAHMTRSGSVAPDRPRRRTRARLIRLSAFPSTPRAIWVGGPGSAAAPHARTTHPAFCVSQHAARDLGGVARLVIAAEDKIA